MVNDKLKCSHLTFLLLAGTIVRFIYGYTTKAWLASPDQLAWGLSIDEMIHSRSFSYLQFIHYPHEGGSFLISIISILFRPFENILPSLSWAALVIDFISRLIQIKVANRIFGKQVALWFGIWTILSIPLLIPWSIVNFGMHALSSFFPFLFIYILVVYKESKYLAILIGVFTGLAFSYSYDNLALILIAIFFIFLSQIFSGIRIQSFSKYIVSLTITTIPHFFTRIFLDTGFGLEKNPVASIRGVPLDNFLSMASLTNFKDVWYKTLPGSLLLNSLPVLSSGMLNILVSVFLIIGVSFFLRSKSWTSQTKIISTAIIISFFFLYSFSPFFTQYYSHKGYVFYRHLSYILPFLILIMIAGFTYSGRKNYFLLFTWILICGIASIKYIDSTKKTEKPLYKAAGWVTARKFGHDITKMFMIREVTKKDYQDELTIGFGWGLSATILENKKDTADLLKLVSKVNECPAQFRDKIIEGVMFSFSDKVTPVLDPKFKKDFDTIVLQRAGSIE